jgi:hypothetical protein
MFKKVLQICKNWLEINQKGFAKVSKQKSIVFKKRKRKENFERGKKASGQSLARGRIQPMAQFLFPRTIFFLSPPQSPTPDPTCHPFRGVRDEHNALERDRPGLLSDSVEP